MKKIWETPQIKNLGIESTMSGDDIMRLWGGDKFAWKCCCGVTSDFIYDTEDEAKKGLEAHKLTSEHGLCPLS